LTGLRPTALRLLKWSNFTHCLDHEGNQAIRYVGSVGGVDGDCKNQKGGVASAKDIPTHFLIFNEMLAFGINPYIIICEHKAQCELVCRPYRISNMPAYRSQIDRKSAIVHNNSWVGRPAPTKTLILPAIFFKKNEGGRKQQIYPFYG